MVTETVDNAELIEEMLRDADPKLEPGTVRPLDVLHKGDGDVGAPAIVSALQSAGYVFIYDSKTGERSLTNKNMLSAQLKKKREDGSLVFTIHKPKVRPFVGKFTCLLHESRPERKEYDVMGYRVCPKSNIPNPYQLNLHMRRKHKVEWEAIEEARKERERQEDKEFQRALMLRGQVVEMPQPKKKGRPKAI